MFLFIDYLFNEFFTLYDKISDPNKDASGRGTHERFNRQIGAEMDEFVMPLIANLQKNLLEPQNCLQSFIPYNESELGYNKDWIIGLALSISDRRNMLAIITRLYQIRGTIFCHELMFSWLGLTATIIEDFADSGLWDDGGTWDDDGEWDTFCAPCSTYRIELTGSVIFTVALVKAIETIIAFNKPINAIFAGYTHPEFILNEDGTPILNEDGTPLMSE